LEVGGAQWCARLEDSLMLRRIVSLLVTFLVANSISAFAAERPAEASAAPLAAAVERAAKEPAPVIAAWAVDSTGKRPAALTALYGTYAGLQALDIVSTRRAIAAGAREQNPLMRGGSVGMMVAVKAATGASTIFFAERLWKKNKAGAVVVMAVLNGASAAIAAHNQRLARR
jgi:hypothetical protein